LDDIFESSAAAQESLGKLVIDLKKVVRRHSGLISEPMTASMGKPEDLSDASFRVSHLSSNIASPIKETVRTQSRPTSSPLLSDSPGNVNTSRLNSPHYTSKDNRSGAKRNNIVFDRLKRLNDDISEGDERIGHKSNNFVSGPLFSADLSRSYNYLDDDGLEDDSSRFTKSGINSLNITNLNDNTGASILFSSAIYDRLGNSLIDRKVGGKGISTPNNGEYRVNNSSGRLSNDSNYTSVVSRSVGSYNSRDTGSIGSNSMIDSLKRLDRLGGSIDSILRRLDDIHL
jgi:hypothetical protein